MAPPVVPPATPPKRAPSNSAPTGAKGLPNSAPPLPAMVERAMPGHDAKAAPPRPVCVTTAAPENPPARAPVKIKLD